MKRNILFFGLLILVFMVGCKTARMTVTAKSAEYPVSITECFYDNEYNLVNAKKYDVLYHFKIKYRKASLFGSRKVKSADLSPELNEFMHSYHGDAVVNVSVKFVNGGVNEYLLDMITCLINFGIFVPAHLVAVVEGDIVKMK